MNSAQIVMRRRHVEPVRASLADGFQQFFMKRSLDGKTEEDPNRIRSGVLALRTIHRWEQVMGTADMELS